MAELSEGLSGYLDVENATLRAPRIEAVSNIGVANTAPQHAFSVGSNLYIDTESSNVITVRGNVVTEGVKVGTIEIIPSYDLAAVSNVGNVTANTIIFTNETQGFVATGNATIGSTLTVSGFRITAAAAAEDDLEAITTAGATTSKAIHITNATDSTTPYTGALQIGTNTGANGGLGVAGNVHVNQGVYTQDLSVSGEIVSNLAVNTDDLFVDIVNSRVGIGTTEPTVALDVVGAVNASGNVAVDTNTLFVDSVNNKVGVGTTEPGATLEVTGNAYVSSNLEVGTANLFVDTVNSRVGIGTTSPNVLLELSSATGSATITPTELRLSSSTDAGDWDTTTPYARLAFYTGDATADAPGVMASIGAVASSADGGENTRLSFFTAEPHVERMCVDRYGNVGIGTASPATKLHVEHYGNQIGDFEGIRIANHATNLHASTRPAYEFVVSDINSGTGIGNGKFAIGYRSTTSASRTDRLVIDNSGRVGIGTTDPTAGLVYRQPNFTYNTPTGGGFRFIQQNTSNYWDIGVVSSTNTSFALSYNGNSLGYYSASGSNIQQNFTGQHRTFIKDVPFSQAGDLEGLIVSSDQNKYIKMSGGIEAGSNAITTNESLPVVSLSKIVNDKKCFGVISASEDPEERSDAYGSFVTPYEKELGDTRVYINSVGEGAMWVTDTNGSLESGDYITTSNVPGYGQKQDSEFLANYTVAKITMDCDFEPVTQPVQIIRKEMGDVNYWVKTTYENVTEEEYSNLTDENRRIVDDVYQKITKEEESKTEQEGYELEVRQELVNVLDTNGQLQWEDHPTETEKAYKIRYLDADGVETDEASAVHKAAFVGCTYHCG
jgi:hypothetical protein